MNAHRSLFALLALLYPLLLRTQVYQDDNLFIPPTITVVDLSTGGPPLLTVTEQHIRRRDPMLPIIFFDNPGEWTLPPRYHTFGSSSEAEGYADTNEIWSRWGWSIHGTTLKENQSVWRDLEERDSYEKYYELLDVIGYRMITHPHATITLHGGYSAEPGETPEVARARIATVRDYLTAIWRLAPERITIGVTEQLSDTSDDLLDHQEARMVVIETENWELIRPVAYTLKWGEYDQENTFSFLMGVESNVNDLNVDSIVVTVYADDNVVGYGAVAGSAGMLNYGLNATLSRLDYHALRSSSLKLDAYVRTTDGVYRRSHAVPISTKATTYAIPLQPNRVVLPFYTHGAASLTDYQRRMLGDIVAETKGKDPIDAFATDIVWVCNEWESHRIDEKASPEYYHYLMDRLESERTRPKRMQPEADPNPLFRLTRTDRNERVFDEMIYSAQNDDGSSGMFISIYTPEPDEVFDVEKLDIARLETIKTHVLATYADSVVPTKQERLYGVMRDSQRDFPLLPEQRWYHRSIAFTLFARHGAHR